jgi:hypothetical protein
MLARLHRVALWLRLAVVCLVLTGISAPAPSVGYREAVVAIAQAREPARQIAAPAPSVDVAKAIATAAPASSWAAPIAVHVAAALSPLPPRRLFLLNRALLC